MTFIPSISEKYKVKCLGLKSPSTYYIEDISTQDFSNPDFSTIKFSNLMVKKFKIEIYGIEKLLWDRIVE